ncbi:MAG: Response regulator containing a CheY-like receiver domain and an DNA-binding domain [Pseudomonadota bacterium]|jgi:DNA-binding NarL/FixJ family response regulator
MALFVADPLIMNPQRKTSVILVDDHAVVRAGYKRYIELDQQLSVVGEAASGEEAYALLEHQQADVLVMDLSMPGQGGFESLRRILNRYPNQKVLIFSMHENASIANQALKLGAVGYLTKSMAPDQIIAAIHDVMRGGKPIAAELKSAIDELNAAARPHHELLPREFEVLVMLASGESIDSISTRLHLSPKTASNYQANIRKKLGVSSAMELQRYAKDHGLVP